MDSLEAVVHGRLSNNSLFFGNAQSEIVSAANLQGGWNGDYSYTVFSTYPWNMQGSSADDGGGPQAGAFAFARWTGAVYNIVSHRTILLGY
ncbi:hypothetical protein FWG76_02320 [Candidatus Saccharibacteria bacterium]|nr:hypothetical protein [Candidatus Saccharibacteria bacterium]